MIILDLNQVMLSNFMVQIGNFTNLEIDENMFRHMVLNSIRSFRNKFSEEYGELVIACDNKNCWRKNVFPYYKANRKKARDNSELDWNRVFYTLNNIRQELKDFFPYRIVDIETAEADDIIATLVFERGTELNNGSEKILILSGDKDFIQLHTFTNVYQYDPVRKKFITHTNPDLFLEEHILKGDSGDGVPNILSSDDCFVVGERQKPLTKKRLSSLLDLGLHGKYDHPLHRNFIRNSQMIDLRFIPKDLKEKIIKEYDSQSNKNKSQLFNYFVKNKLKMLMEHIHEF